MVKEKRNTKPEMNRIKNQGISNYKSKSLSF